MYLTKSFETIQTPVEAGAPDLAAIRKYALRDVTPEEVWTGSMKLCHDRVDRSHERFSKAYLERFAETLPGKAVLPGHDYSALPLGRFYDAEVVPDAEGHHLRVRYYLPRTSELVPQIELGVLKDVSIGFNAGKRVCGICQKDWDFSHEHRPGETIDGKTCTLTYCETEAHKAEAMEGSFVWCGCQPGAEAVSMAAKTGFGIGLTLDHQPRFWTPPLVTYTTNTTGGGTPLLQHPPHREESGMYKTIDEAVAEIERLKALPLASAREKELLDEISALKAKAEDGDAYRAHLQAEMKRLAGSLDAARNSKAKSEYVDMLLGQLGDVPATALAKFLKPLQEEFDAAFAQGSGQPAEPGGTKTEKKASPFGRFASGGLF